MFVKNMKCDQEAFSNFFKTKYGKLFIFLINILSIFFCAWKYSNLTKYFQKNESQQAVLQIKNAKKENKECNEKQQLKFSFIAILILL